MDAFSVSDRLVVEKTSIAIARIIRGAILDGRLEPDQPLPAMPRERPRR